MKRGRPRNKVKSPKMIRRSFFLTEQQNIEFDKQFEKSNAKGISDYVWQISVGKKEI